MVRKTRITNLWNVINLKNEAHQQVPRFLIIIILKFHQNDLNVLKTE